jgi:hypothetical protein
MGQYGIERGYDGRMGPVADFAAITHGVHLYIKNADEQDHPHQKKMGAKCAHQTPSFV